jgi:hypothetical protein
VITATVHASGLRSSHRLDAKYFTSPGVRARETVRQLAAQGFVTRTIGGAGGFGTVASSTRTKRIYAAPGEDSVPYLRPYDVFDYLPLPADLLSKTASPGLATLMPEPGTILQTCSGRNLGPLAYADEYIARFAVSDDMLRLKIDAEADRLYVMTFLMTRTGQALLSQNKTGAVIDHLSPDDLAAVAVPLGPDKIVNRVVSDMRSAVQLREAARKQLGSAIQQYEALYPTPDRVIPLKNGWTVRAVNLTGRVDAARYDQAVSLAADALRAAGGAPLADVAQAFIPGRYTRYYVEQAYGRPIVSGRQLLQAQPVNLRYIAGRSFDFDDYVLAENMLAFGAEGRAEEGIGFPSLITSDRADWLANNHVMRVRPKEGVHPGWLYLAFASRSVLVQVKAVACGSVVDTVYPGDLLNVIIPPIDAGLADEASAAWKALADARKHELAAIGVLQAWVTTVAGTETPVDEQITAA